MYFTFPIFYNTRRVEPYSVRKFFSRPYNKLARMKFMYLLCGGLPQGRYGNRQEGRIMEMNGMKRGIILFAALLVAGMTAEAQTQNTFGGGDIVLSAGIGAGTALNIGNTVVPPIVIQGEYGIVDNLFDAYSSIGVSGYMGFAAKFLLLSVRYVQAED